MKKVILVVFLFLVYFTLRATNYYVSTNGSDANDGLSELTPWKTIQKVNIGMQNSIFIAGDNILFKRGDVWVWNNSSQGTLVAGRKVFLHIRNLVGTINSKITIGAYGTGDIPVFQAATNAISEPEYGNIIYINASSTTPVYNLTIENIRLTSSNRTMEMSAIGTTTPIDGLETNVHITNFTIQNLTIDNLSRGIAMTVKNFDVLNNIIKDNDQLLVSGVHSHSFGIWTGPGTRDGNIIGNQFENNGANSYDHHLYLGGGVNIIVNENIFKVSSSSTLLAGSAISLHNGEYPNIGMSNIIVSQNSFDNNKSVAISLEPDSDNPNQQIDNIMIERNIFKNNRYVLRMVSNDNVTFQNNIVYGSRTKDTRIQVSDNIAGVKPTDKNIDNFIIQNNTFYQNNALIVGFNCVGSYFFHNNIVYDTLLGLSGYQNISPLRETSASGLTVTKKNNIYYLPYRPKIGGQALYYQLNSSSKTLTQTNEINAGSFYYDGIAPLFLDTTNYDFHLSEGSPAIDAGYNSGLSYDYDGNSRYNGTSIDIGAFEFSAPTKVSSSNIDGKIQYIINDGFYVSAPKKHLFVRVYTINGLKIIEKNIYDDSFINLGSLNSGIYIAIIDGVCTKLIKK